MDPVVEAMSENDSVADATHGEPEGAPAPPPARSSEQAAPESSPGEQPVVEAPTPWGRIDADGDVYVRTDDGERLIGSWQAGDVAEGLAFYERQYADLAVTIELLLQRVTRGLVDPAEARKKVAELRMAVESAAVIGDLGALSRTLDAVAAGADAAKERREAARLAARAEALARKTALVEEAESLAGSTAWKASGDRLRAIVEEFKVVRGLDRQTDQELWKRYQEARDEFSRRRGAHFATLDEQRKAAVLRKEELIREAESLATSVEWKATADRLKAMMEDWKTLPRVSRDQEESLWLRFRAAQDTFFGNRSKAFGERDAEYRENLAAKVRLLEAAEAIDPAVDLDSAKEHLRTLKAQWDRIGKVPRDSIASLDSRFRALDDRVRSAQDAAWTSSRRASNPLAAQFREQIARLEAQAAKARAAGRIADAERAESAAATWRTSLDEAEKRA